MSRRAARGPYMPEVEVCLMAHDGTLYIFLMPHSLGPGRS